MWNKLVDRWALVTGASAGIGAELARQLAARGMHLVLTARRSDLMEVLAKELHEKHATRCEIIAVDLASPAGPQTLVAEIERRRITIDLLVNNAGFGVVGDVEHTPLDRVMSLINLNVAATTELTYRLLPGMLERKFGAILNMSSLSAFQPVAYMGVYAASKAFVLHFSEALACEVQTRGITVLAVCPGVTKTAFFDLAGASGWLQKHAAQTPEQVVRTALKALGRRRWVVVPGWRNYFLTLLVRIASRRRVVKESRRFFRPRRSRSNDSSTKR